MRPERRTRCRHGSRPPEKTCGSSSPARWASPVLKVYWLSRQRGPCEDGVCPWCLLCLQGANNAPGRCWAPTPSVGRGVWPTGQCQDSVLHTHLGLFYYSPKALRATLFCSLNTSSCMLQLKVRMPAKTESGRIGGNGGGRWTGTPAALCYGFLAPSHYLAHQLVALL